MIAKDKRLRKICKKYEQVENYAEAVADETQMWIMHHRKEIDEGKSAKELDDEGNYINVPPEDLIFITWSEHSKLHNEGENNPMFGRRGELAPAFGRTGSKHPMFGKTGEKNPFYGKTHTEAVKKKLSEMNKGENHPQFGWHWWTNGIVEIKAKECPEGFVPGRLKRVPNK